MIKIRIIVWFKMTYCSVWVGGVSKCRFLTYFLIATDKIISFFLMRETVTANVEKILLLISFATVSTDPVVCARKVIDR